MPAIMHKVIALVFAAMAVIQYNDPDPLYWIVVYAATAWVTATADTRFESSAATLVAVGLAVAGLLISAPGFVDYVVSGSPASIANSMDSQAHVEPAREFLGLLLALAALLYCARRSARARPRLA